MPKKPKYAHLKLPKMPAENPAYQDRVEAVKQVILTPPKADDPPALDLSNLLHSIDQRMKAVHGTLLRSCAGKRQATALATAYAELRSLSDQIKAWESNTNLLLEAYSQLMIDQMEVEGVSKLGLDGIGLVSTWMEPYSRVSDKEAFRLWAMRECEHCMKPRTDHFNHDGLLKGYHTESVTKDDGTTEEIRLMHVFQPNDLQRLITLPWQTIDSLSKKMLLAGEPLPPGVEAFAKTKIRLGAE